MYICNCHGIRKKEVKTVINLGIKNWDQVHAHSDCEPCCGKCEDEITEMIINFDKN
ncbi:(2Fe-2S)-binding protein [Alphaproteobacteria bacterium]|nr:(2Fe-2S)-binding protein [Alphaproteobacteria bacterium]